nr:DUF4166 domain-containing protein [uncultured Rhodoferax sp.]
MTAMAILSPMAQCLGAQWTQLHPTLQAHHAGGRVREVGALDVSFPRWMAPVVWCLQWVGALVNRAQAQVHTVVNKETTAAGQTFDRTLTYSDGEVLRFNSRWVAEPGGRLVEYVQRWLALELAPRVVGDTLHCEGVCFIVHLGGLQLRWSERWLLGHTVIREHALDAERYAMDFRMIHPWLGEVFRYAGVFSTDAQATR